MIRLFNEIARHRPMRLESDIPDSWARVVQLDETGCLVACARTIPTLLKRCLGIALALLLGPSGAWAGCGDHVVMKSQRDNPTAHAGNPLVIPSDLAPGAASNLPKWPCGLRCSKHDKPLSPGMAAASPSASDLLLLPRLDWVHGGEGSYFVLPLSFRRFASDSAELFRPPRRPIGPMSAS